MSSQLRIGVIGAGSIFRQRHFPALTERDDVSVVAIANRSVESAREIATEFDLGATALDDPSAVFDADDIDAVMIGTWPYKHHEYTVRALDAGKHVFVQARMASSLSEAKSMLARAEEADLVTQICPSPYGMRGGKWMQERIEDGYLGTLRAVRARVTSGRRGDPTDPLHWREIERYQGINALSVGILVEVLHRWVGHASSVSATAATAIEERPLPDGTGTGPVELPDSVFVTCRFENGAIGSLDFSSVAEDAPADQVSLYGSEGTLVYDLEADAVYGARGDEDLTRMEIPEAAANEWTVEADFVEAVRNGGAPRATFREGVRYMEFSEAVFRSVESGSRVSLPLRT